MITLSEIVDNIGGLAEIEDPERLYYTLPPTGIKVIEGFERTRDPKNKSRIITRVILSDKQNSNHCISVAPEHVRLVRRGTYRAV